MRFAPKTEEQIAAENLCREGQFPFTVKQAAEKQDKNRKSFFAIKLFVHDGDRDWHVYDNVSPEWMAHKLLHLCEGTGLGAKYLSGNVTADDLIERQGYCEVSMEDAKGGYAAKNIIVDYVVKTADKMAPPAPAAPAPVSDDDVPF